MLFEYALNGRVSPERVAVSINPSPLHLRVVLPLPGLDCDVHISVQVSQISILVRSAQPISDLVTLKNYVQELVQTELDCYGFLRGYAYTAEIDSCTSYNPESHIVFSVHIAEIEAKASERPVDFAGLLSAAFDPAVASESERQVLRQALDNFRLAIKNPRDTGMYSYRALECIWQALGKNWSVLNYELNVDKTWSDDMRAQHAQNQRHGKSTFMTHADRVDMICRIQKVIDRFVLYLKAGRKRLDPTAFPVLIH